MFSTTALFFPEPRDMGYEQKLNYFFVAVCICLLFTALNGYLINRFIPKKKSKWYLSVPRVVIAIVMLAAPMLFGLLDLIDPIMSDAPGWPPVGVHIGIALTCITALWTAFWVIIELLRQKNASLKRTIAPEAPQKKRDGLPLWLSGILWLLTFFCIYIFPSLDQLYGYQWLGTDWWISAFGTGILIASGVVNVIALIFAAVILIHTLILTFTLRRLVKHSKAEAPADFSAPNGNEEQAETPAESADPDQG